MTEQAKQQNAPSPEEVAELKKTHGKVFKLSVNDRQYCFRTLKRQEHLKIVSSMEAVEPANRQIMFDEAIVRNALVWPKVDPAWYSTCDAGDVATLAGFILEKSGFTQDVKVEEI